MRPEPRALAPSRAALERWQELCAAYDAIDQALTAPDAADLGTLAARVVALEDDLRPRIAELAALRASTAAPEPEVERVWHAIDDVVRTLARRQPELVRAALAARAGAAKRLDDLRVQRTQLGQYAGRAASAPRLTSRSA